jgi:hypothetical protein
MVFNFANSCEKRSGLVESDSFGNFHLFENSVVLDKNSTLCGHIEDDSNNTGHGETQSAGAGGNQYTDTSFDNIANFAKLILKFNLFEEEKKRPNEHSAQTEDNHSFHKYIRDALADGLNA